MRRNRNDPRSVARVASVMRPDVRSERGDFGSGRITSVATEGKARFRDQRHTGIATTRGQTASSVSPSRTTTDDVCEAARHPRLQVGRSRPGVDRAAAGLQRCGGFTRGERRRRKRARSGCRRGHVQTAPSRPLGGYRPMSRKQGLGWSKSSVVSVHVAVMCPPVRARLLPALMALV